MKAALLSRLQRLETRSGGAHKALKLLLGPLRQLPANYTGERHVVITKREPTDSPTREECEFEERPGPGPHLQFEEDTMLIFFVAPPERVPA